MAIDMELVERWRAAIEADPDLSSRDLDEKRMMGGVVFMIDGNMLGGCRQTKDGERLFMFRVGKEREAEALSRPGARRVDMGARRMPGFIHVRAEDCDAAALAGWAALAGAHVLSLPPK